jgi:hypothetical protein
MIALLLMPPDDAETVHNGIPGQIDDGEGNFAIPCNTNTSLEVEFNGQKFTISPKDYVGATIDDSGGLCVSNILGQQVGTATEWLMGDVFLKNVTKYISRIDLRFRCTRSLITRIIKLDLEPRPRAGRRMWLGTVTPSHSWHHKAQRVRVYLTTHEDGTRSHTLWEQ